MNSLFACSIFGICWVCGRSLHISSRGGGSGPTFAASNESGLKKAGAGQSHREGHAGNASRPQGHLGASNMSLVEAASRAAGDGPHHHQQGHHQQGHHQQGHSSHHQQGHSSHHADTEAMTQRKDEELGSAEKGDAAAERYAAKAAAKADYKKRLAHFKACLAERDFNISKHFQTRKCKRPENPDEEKEEKKENARRSLPLLTAAEFEAYTFEDFVQDFKRSYRRGTSFWQNRQEIFQANLEALIKFRKEVGPSSWGAGITMFLDYSAEEYQQQLSLRVDRRKKAGAHAPEKAQSLARRSYEEMPAELSLVDADVPLSGFVRSQGSCGSCWAAAATSTIEGALLKNTAVRSLVAGRARTLGSPMETLSTEAVVSCTENPRHCGGSGGCSGATVELAFDMVKSKGLPLAAEWPYASAKTGHQESCDTSHFKVPVLVTLDSYKVLPSNDFTSLLSALVQRGQPIAVSVDASNWYYYAGGVYSDMDVGQGDFTVNHAVTLVGFRKPPEGNASSELDGAGSGELPNSTQKGSQASRGYYLIKNSWGPWFGESGFIRIEMKKNESGHCGWDMDPRKGVACEGDPEKAWVCGTCGILYDSVYPEGVRAIQHNASSVAVPVGGHAGGKRTESGLSRGANWKP